MSLRAEPSRRQEKVARVIRESVSTTISSHLNDPRIQGIVSVTEVDVSPDLRNADVFLSILAADETQAKKTLLAIQHATRHIQSRLSEVITSKFCPRLRFDEDRKFKKTMETLRLIETVTEEFREEPEDERDSAQDE
jgi:ribosome-binding factor A